MRTGVDHFCNSCTADIDGTSSVHKVVTRSLAHTHCPFLRNYGTVGTKVLVTPGIEQSQVAELRFQLYLNCEVYE